jgi:hypothetical protein
MPEFGCQESELMAWRIAPRHAGFACLLNTLVSPPDTPLAELAPGSVSKLCLEQGVNVIGRDALLAEKPNDDRMVVFHPLNGKP